MSIALVSIACYVSANPSPVQWVVSGEPAGVARVTNAMQRVRGAEVLARIEAAGIGFARFRFPHDLVFREFGPLIFEAQRAGLLFTALTPDVPSCRDGGVENWRDEEDDPLLVGLLGDPAHVAAAMASIPWVQTFPIRTSDGREGMGFNVEVEQAEGYQAFVERVVKEEWAGLVMVLLKHQPA